MTRHVEDAIRLDDPAWYMEDGFHAQIDELRRTDPVHFLPELNTHLLTRHADIRLVGRTPEVFSSASGMLINDIKFGGNVAESFFPEGAELITTSDPPRHRELRRVISPSFAAPVIARMESLIRDKSRELIAGIRADTEFDFVEQVAVALPVYVVTELLGMEDASVADVRRWSDDMTRMGGDLSQDELAELAASLGPMNEYLMGQLAAKRGHVGDNLLSTLLRAEIDNEKLTDMNVLMLTTATMVAGNETTRNLIADTVHALATHPGERARVVDDPGRCDTAVDEVLRYVSPVAGFARRALIDTEVGGTAIRAGQYVYMLYMAGNRDEAAFSDPHRFDVARQPQPGHLAFGFGEHVCPGSSLARLEAKVLLEELVDRFGSWELGDGARPVMSVLSNGFEYLPVTFRER